MQYKLLRVCCGNKHHFAVNEVYRHQSYCTIFCLAELYICIYLRQCLNHLLLVKTLSSICSVFVCQQFQEWILYIYIGFLTQHLLTVSFSMYNMFSFRSLEKLTWSEFNLVSSFTQECKPLFIYLQKLFIKCIPCYVFVYTKLFCILCSYKFFLQSLLSDPNPNSPANSMAAQLYKENRREYEKRVKACVEQSFVD